MKNDMYTSVRDWCECVWNKACEILKRPLQLFSETGPLEPARIDILEPLSRMSSHNKIVLVMTDIYLKFWRAVKMFKKTASQIVSMFIESLIILYGKTEYMFSWTTEHSLFVSFSSVFASFWERNT